MIDGFLATGNVPESGNIDLLRELAGEDWLALDADGRVSVLYPFSLEPSGIAVTHDDAERYAMCAIDALGIAAMLKTDVDIRATCPTSGETLRIQVSSAGDVDSEPDGVVVVRRRQGGAAHVSRCAATRFFRSGEDADAWLATSGTSDDVVLELWPAYEEAATIFGRAYSDGLRLVI